MIESDRQCRAPCHRLPASAVQRLQTDSLWVDISVFTGSWLLPALSSLSPPSAEWAAACMNLLRWTLSVKGIIQLEANRQPTDDRTYCALWGVVVSSLQR